MSNNRPVKFTLYIIALWGFLSFCFLPDFSRSTILFLVLLIVPSWFIVRTSDPFPGYGKAWIIATFLFLIISCLDLLLNSRPPYLTLAYQLSFLQLGKLYNIKRPRDYFQILFLAFTMVVVTAIKAEQAIFPLMLLPFLIMTIYGFALLTVEREQLLLGEAGEKSGARLKRQGRVAKAPAEKKQFSYGPKVREVRKLHSVLSLASIGVFILTAFFFFFFPRSTRLIRYGEKPLYDSSSDNELLLTGYSKTIDLGSLAKILRDPTVLMKVRTNLPISEQQLYLRGATLDLFDGKRWDRGASARNLKKLERSKNKNMVILDDKRFMDKEHLIQQDIEMLDLDSRTLFYLPPLVALTSLKQNIYCDASNCISVSQLKPFSPKYTVYSYLPEKTSLDYSYCMQMESGDFDFEPYLLIHPRPEKKDDLATLAETITQNCATDFEKAKAIQSYLTKNYDYTLDLRTIDLSQPVTDFLFRDKRGHCELFATSMVLLLRSLDIPARLVTGFRGGDFKKDTNTYEIRRMDAHTWAEAYIEGRGWYQFDPTPAPPMEIFSGRIYFKKLKDFYERLSLRWQNLVIGYNSHIRDKIFGSAVQRLRETWDSVFRSRLLAHFWNKFSTNITQPPLIALALFLLVVNIVAAFVSVRLRRSGIPLSALMFRSRSKYYLSYLYEKIVRSIYGKALRKKPGFTPREFALSLADAKNKNPEVVEEIMKIYYALRFGDISPSAELARRIDLLLKQLH